MIRARAARAALRAARRFTSVVATVSVAVLILAPPAEAHGESILQRGAERIEAGGVIEVRGDLGTGEVFEVVLVATADGTRRLIATIPAVEEGHFQSFVTVPTDVPTGEYLLEVAVDLDLVRAPLTIAGSPIVPGGAGPDQGAGLVEPLPSGLGVAAAGSSGAAVASGSGGAPPRTPSRRSRSPLDGAIVIALAFSVGAALLLAARVLGRRSPASSSDEPS